MIKVAICTVSVVVGAVALAAVAQVKPFTPVTQQMLENPKPDDWLMFSRTYDAQRFSPLRQINKENVRQLGLAWSRGMAAGSTETVPIVYNGVMYVITPAGTVQALDAANGDMVWEYKREGVTRSVAKALAIFEDLVIYTAADSHVVGIDARTGAQRWATKTDTRGNSSGAIVVEGKVISGGSCGSNRINCYIAAHDARTGKELWRFYTTPAPGEPGDESWAGVV
jgi:alcohol dehydrogenase (cytochrome c)